MSVPTLLIVDDSKAQRFIVRRCLEKQEVQILGEAVDGRDAVQKYCELTPDLMLLDLVMPVMDGKAALGEILEIDPGARVIVTTSLGSDDAVRECLSLGAHSFLQKPFSTEVLMRAIRGAMGVEIGSA